MLRAADSLASESLRSPSRAKLLALSAPGNENAHTRWASEKLAERTGLEPATPGVTGRYSNQLNYRSIRALAARERGELYPTVGLVSSSLALPSFDNRPFWRLRLL